MLRGITSSASFSRWYSWAPQMGDQDTVYISGLPKGVTEDQLADRFGSIGIIKLDKKTKQKKFGSTRIKRPVRPRATPR